MELMNGMQNCKVSIAKHISSYFVPPSVLQFHKCGLPRGFTSEVLQQFMVSLCVPHFTKVDPPKKTGLASGSAS